MRYKIVARVNLLLGIAQITYSSILLFVVIPRFREIYDTFDSPLQTPPVIIPLIVLFSGVFAIALAIFLLRKNGPVKNKLFIISLIYLCLLIISGGIITGASVLSVIIPLYSVTSNL